MTRQPHAQLTPHTIVVILRAQCQRCLRPVREHAVSTVPNVATGDEQFECPTDHEPVSFGRMLLGGKE